jgi:hypothetical protein
MIFSQEGGGGSTPYQHHVAMYEGPLIHSGAVVGKARARARLALHLPPQQIIMAPYDTFLADLPIVKLLLKWQSWHFFRMVLKVEKRLFL